MKIQGFSETNPVDPSATEARSKVARTSPSAPVDSVKLSELSRSLQQQGAAAVEPGFDAAKVESIKAAMAAGTFKVDPQKVADQLIASVSDLLTRRAN